VETERALNALNVETARNYKEASEKTLKQITEALSMRTVTVAQMATSIMTNSNPHFLGCSVQEAVKLAQEILAEVEHPTPDKEPKEHELVTRKIAGVKNPPIVRQPGMPVRMGWYDQDH
jgi:hypothetical protein